MTCYRCGLATGYLWSIGSTQFLRFTCWSRL